MNPTTAAPSTLADPRESLCPDTTPVDLTAIFRNLLIGGEPGGGKSCLLNLITARAALPEPRGEPQ
jgi:hypothetical protein